MSKIIITFTACDRIGKNVREAPVVEARWKLEYDLKHNNNR